MSPTPVATPGGYLTEQRDHFLAPSLSKLLEIRLQRKAKQQTNNLTAPDVGKYMHKQTLIQPQYEPSLSKTESQHKVIGRFATREN